MENKSVFRMNHGLVFGELNYSISTSELKRSLFSWLYFMRKINSMPSDFMKDANGYRFLSR